MRALVWKELRENFKWALLAMVVLGAAEYYALTYSEYGYPEYYYNDGITLCRKTFLTITTFGCIAVGALLGLIQILPELKRDQWAALLHRPVSRGRVFMGKVIAGLLLYGLATGLPFLILVWMVSTPGNFPCPFVPAMIKPGVADIFGGAMYYFAALALTLPRGWTLWRGLPLLAAIDASYFIQESSLFYVAIEAAVLMSIALVVAAWGLIYNQDRFHSRPWLGKVAFLAVAFFGVCGLGDLAKTLSQTFLKNPPSSYQRYQLGDDGTPLLLTFTSNVVVSVKDLDGKSPVNPKYQPDRVRNSINYLSDVSDYIGDSHGWKRQRYSRGYRDSSEYIQSNSPYSYPRLEQWFCLVEENVYVGYLPAEKRAFSRLDADGFQSVSSPAKSFDRNVEISNAGGDAWFIIGWQGLRYVNLAKREVIVPAVPEPGPIYGIGQVWARTEGQPYSATGVSFGHGVGIFDNKAKLITMLPYRQDMEKWGNVLLGVNPTGDRFYLWYQPSVWISGKVSGTMPQYIDEVNLKGEVLHHYTLPPLPDSVFKRPLDYVVTKFLRTPFFFFGTMLYQKAGAELGSERLQKALAWRLNGGWKDTRDIILWISCLSSGLAVMTFCWAKRKQFSSKEAAGWALFVLLFNFAGLLAFRLCADWPTLIACPGCSESRPVEAETCHHCGSNWPLPEKNGAEIFDATAGLALANPVKN